MRKFHGPTNKIIKLLLPFGFLYFPYNNKCFTGLWKWWQWWNWEGGRWFPHETPRFSAKKKVWESNNNRTRFQKVLRPVKIAFFGWRTLPFGAKMILPLLQAIKIKIRCRKRKRHDPIEAKGTRGHSEAAIQAVFFNYPLFIWKRKRNTPVSFPGKG